MPSGSFSDATGTDLLNAFAELKLFDLADEALPLLRRSLELSQPGDSIVRKLFALIVQCQRQLKQPAEAVKVCLAGRQYFPDDAELLFQEALARNEHRDFQGAEKWYPFAQLRS